MPTTITCPECDAKMVVPDNLLGKKLRCKKCQAVVKTKAPVDDDDDEPRPKKSSGRQPPKPTADEERRSRRKTEEDEPRRRARNRDEDDEEEEEDDEDERPARKSTKTKKKKKRGPVYYVGLLLAFLLAGGAVYWVVVRSGIMNKEVRDDMRVLAKDGEVGVPNRKEIVAHEHFDLSNFRTETVRSTEVVHIDYKSTNHMKPELDYLIVTQFEGGFETTEFRGDKNKGDLLLNVPPGGWKPGSKIWLGRPQSTNPGALPIRVSNIVTVP